MKRAHHLGEPRPHVEFTGGRERRHLDFVELLVWLGLIVFCICVLVGLIVGVRVVAAFIAAVIA